MAKSTLRVQEALLLPESTSSKRQETNFVTFRKLSCRYSTEEENTKLALENVDFELSKGQTLGVIGPVGCGKSTLLNCIIEETEVVDGEMKVNEMKDSVCYTHSSELHRSLFQVPATISITTQEAWIFGGTIQENILMNLKMDKNRYREVINATCLSTDLKNFKNGDQTLVGEKGATLSGGQQARVSLARCLYAQEGYPTTRRKIWF